MNIWNVRGYSRYHIIADGRPKEIRELSRQRKRHNDPKDWIMADKNGGFPAIVSKELFDLVQLKRKERGEAQINGRAAVAPYYLSGLAMCAKCGQRLFGHVRNNGRKKGYQKYYYYECGGSSAGKELTCKGMRMPKERLEEPVFEALGKRLEELSRPENIRKAVEVRQKEGIGISVSELQSKLDKVEFIRSNWEKAVEMGLDYENAIANLNRLAKAKEMLLRELEIAREREELIRDKDALHEWLSRYYERCRKILSKGNLAEKKELIRNHLEKVEVCPDSKEFQMTFKEVPARLF